MARAHLRGAELKELARTLAFPRRSGSAGAERIVGLVADRLRRTGLEVAVEPFSFDLRPARRALRLVLVGSAVLLGAAGWTVEP